MQLLKLRAVINAGSCRKGLACMLGVIQKGHSADDPISGSSLSMYIHTCIQAHTHMHIHQHMEWLIMNCPIASTLAELEALVLTSGGDEVSSHHYYPQEEPIPPGCYDILRILGLEPTYTPRVKIPYQLINERAKKRNSKISVLLQSVAIVAIMMRLRRDKRLITKDHTSHRQ